MISIEVMVRMCLTAGYHLLSGKEALYKRRCAALNELPIYFVYVVG